MISQRRKQHRRDLALLPRAAVRALLETRGQDLAHLPGPVGICLTGGLEGVQLSATAAGLQVAEVKLQLSTPLLPLSFRLGNFFQGS